MKYNNHYENLVHVLVETGKKSGQRGIRFLDRKESEDFLSYSDLYRDAVGVLHHLQGRGIKPGDQLVFQLENNRDFVLFFWAGILGGIVPVPVTVGTVVEFQLKLFNIWNRLANPYLVTVKKHLDKLSVFARENNKDEIFKQMKERTLLVEEIDPGAGKGNVVLPAATDTAYIQFSSGSTDAPKGVVLTHKNLLTNISAILNGFEYPPTGIDRYLSWMPLTHDMGLIGFHLTPLTAGWDQALMPPQLFVRYPALWLQEMGRFKSTLTVSPNFGYKYVLKHFTAEGNQGLDLSALRIIVNGAEPISPRLCDQFHETLAPFGLRGTAIFPAYGLAEASVAVSVSIPQEEVAVVYLDRNSLHIGQRARVRDNGEDPDTISFVEVGPPVRDCRVKIVDEKGKTCEDYVIGEIHIKGDNVTSGYYNDPAATAAVMAPGGWLGTGDLGFFRNGRLVITGRAKDVIFANGQNYYPHDLERAAEEVEGIEFEKVAVCGIPNPELHEDEIVAFVVFRKALVEFLPLAAALKNQVREKMALEVAVVIPVKKVPKTTSGKLQRHKLRKQYQDGEYAVLLQELVRLEEESRPLAPGVSLAELEGIVTGAWCRVLNLPLAGVPRSENFFDLGGDSARALQVKGKLQESLGIPIDEAALFKYPTIEGLTAYLSSSLAGGGAGWLAARKARLASFSSSRRRVRERLPGWREKEPGTRGAAGRGGWEIAVTGMSGRFPGADTIAQFWENLKNGVESLSFFSEAELSESGFDLRLIQDPNYIKAKGILEHIDYFDASFFRYTPLEAAKMDPQMRVLHECSWEALESAGCNPADYPGLIGVYVGASPNPYWERAFGTRDSDSASRQFLDTQLLDKDFMTTRLSYKLNLTGPSFTVYTACSTSLVAVDIACQGLWNGKCDLALAGGVSIWLPQKSGYLYEEGMLFSRDGHNRTFSRQASGTVFSDGAGIVVLKRLEDALADNDQVEAILTGTATNNDGSRKAGYSAPALEGQAEVIAAARQMAGLGPEEIDYIEAHGTATALGDAIEIDALKLAYDTGKKNYCALGSVKANLGHLNAAAGVAGLIKTVLMLKHRLIPPALHAAVFNPAFALDGSPFYINTRLLEWKKEGQPRRAGVSSFGIGGTNAHVILEEAPGSAAGESKDGREYRLILLSAKSDTALERMGRNLAVHLQESPGINLADAAYTLQVGREHFPCRQALVCTRVEEAIRGLSASSPADGSLADEPAVLSSSGEGGERPVIFVFPGIGSQYVDMGRELYEKEPRFRREMDRCFEILATLTTEEFKPLLYPPAHGDPASSPSPGVLNRMELAQPITFIFGYSLAVLMESWGITPRAMMGYSFGEYIAACVAGVFSLEEALKLVVRRGELVRQTAPGAMLSVPLDKETLTPLLHPSLAIAVDNGPSCIVAGAAAEVEALASLMKTRKTLCMRLETAHAVHSPLMDSILKPFTAELEKITLHKPRIPYISNVSGTWLRDREAVDPGYWVRQLRSGVRFAEGLTRLLKNESAVFLEVGAGVALSTLIRQLGKSDTGVGPRVVNLVQHPEGREPALRFLCNRIGRLWLYGVKPDWRRFNAGSGEKRCRIPLPVYPFEGQYYPVLAGLSPRESRPGSAASPALTGKKPDIADWFYIPSWQPISPAADTNKKFCGGPGKHGGGFSKEPPGRRRLNSTTRLVFVQGSGIASQLLEQWQNREGEEDLVTVAPGPAFVIEGDRAYRMNPGQQEDYHALFGDLHAAGRLPGTIVHLWALGRDHERSGEFVRRFNRAQDLGFYSLIHIAQALEKVSPAGNTRVVIVGSGMLEVGEEDGLEPEKATLLGPVLTINQEYPGIRCRCIDIALPGPAGLAEEELVRQLLREIDAESAAVVVAYRDNGWWERTFVPVKAEVPGEISPRLRKNGVYLVTGGLGGIGFLLAAEMVRRFGAKLALTGRTPLPPEQEWSRWLETHPAADPLSRKLTRVLELRQQGADLAVFSADAADREQMEAVVRAVEERWGPINGVIHAAGIVGEESLCLIDRLSRADVEAQFRAKVHGLYTLETVFRDRDLDFCLVMSSISSLLGGLALTAYSSANLFMDAFVARHHGDSNGKSPWISVNWDLWQLAEEWQRSGYFDRALGEFAMKPGEGTAAFYRVLSMDHGSQVVVSTGDLPTRVQKWATLKPAAAPVLQPRRNLLTAYLAPRNRIEAIMAGVIRAHLGIGQVGVNDSFFDLGATSLDLVQINTKLNRELEAEVPLVKLLTYTTIAAFADYFTREVLGGKPAAKETGRTEALQTGKESIEKRLSQKDREVESGQVVEAGRGDSLTGREIAVIGMAVRFPGASTLEEFWENLKNGMESISFFCDEELEASGTAPELLADPGYVKVKGVMAGVEYFDASFFDYSPREAEMMDPQTRVFHECTWEVLERAGYDPHGWNGAIGLYIGASPNYYWDALYSSRHFEKMSEQFAAFQFYDKDFMGTRISHKLNLKGPAFTTYTACSSSLVAIHLACGGLLGGECDMALAGGISIWLPEKTGYLYEDGMILSVDGHVRTFDEQASGSVFGDGAGVVMLKRLKAALADGDMVYAVIKGTAINNDGGRKLAYTAPSVEGQGEVIAAALEMAELDPRSISYLEAHGTATPLGDTTEIEMLTRVFGSTVDPAEKYCGIGTVKTNLGHLNAAAGAAGFIKTVLALVHRQIPPSLNFTRPNPRIDFEHSPFYVNTQLKEWDSGAYPLRAGVSSFGIGGTNAHAVLEEAPASVTGENKKTGEYRLILLSAKTSDSLETAAANLADFFREHPGVSLADAAYTLQVGRRPFRHRRMAVCAASGEAGEILSTPGSGKVFTVDTKGKKPAVIFMFPGQGAQYVDMGLGLYRSERVFRETMDRCFAVFQSLMGYDIKTILYPAEPATPTSPPTATESNNKKFYGGPGKHGSGFSKEPPGRRRQGAADLHRTEISQPAIFIFEYALASLLSAWGIRPDVMIGYSFGEYAAACLAGVLTLEDAIKLVALRGRLMQQMPPGAMLSVPLPLEELEPLIPGDLAVAVDNGPSCIVSGTGEAIAAFEQQMKKRRHLCIRVSIAHASHSEVMAPILAEFEAEVRKVELKEPQIPYISNVTGKAAGAEVTDPLYWVKHLRDMVRFGEGIKQLLEIPGPVFVEVGPGRDLSVLLRSHKDESTSRRMLDLVRHENSDVPDLRHLLNRVGHLWLYGVEPDWRGFYAEEKRYRIPLPTVRFAAQHFPVEGLARGAAAGQAPAGQQHKSGIDDWFYRPVWKRTALSKQAEVFATGGNVLLFMDEGGLAAKISVQLEQQGFTVVSVRRGEKFARLAENRFSLAPAEKSGYEALFAALKASGQLPATVFHLWSVSKDAELRLRRPGGSFEKPPPGPPQNFLLSEGDRSRFGLESDSEPEGPPQNFLLEQLDSGYYSLIALVQAFAGEDAAYGFQLKVLSSNVFDVIGGEALCPEKATLLGPVNVIDREFSSIRCCMIDVVVPEPGSRAEQELVEQLVREAGLKIRGASKVIAYRGSHRWVQAFEPVPLAAPPGETHLFREKGVYLVTGGLGGIGLILAEYLAGTAKARLILTGRSPFPPREEWDQRLSTPDQDPKILQGIRKIREMEALGAEVRVSRADVASFPEMQQVVTEAEQCFGKLNGVIHAAGLPDGALISLRTREMSEQVMAPKIEGTLVLDRVLQDRDPDFVVFCSSIASLLSFPGQIAYAAANAFMDAFAARATLKNGVTPMAINWDRWQGVGIAVIAEQEHRKLTGGEMESGIESHEALEVFNRVLADPIPRVIVSVSRLETRQRQLETLDVSFYGRIAREADRPKTTHQRPELSVTYVKPGSDIEKKLAGIWQRYLGLDRVGVHDNFFELGATSLDIIQVNTRINRALETEIPVIKLLTYTTIRSFAGYVSGEVLGTSAPAPEIDRTEVIQRGKKSLQQKYKLRKELEAQ